MAERRDFTDRFLKAVRPCDLGKRVILYDGQVPGFGLRVTDKSTPTAVGSFVLVARYPGSANPTARQIGTYPAMSLARAREVAREWRDALARGVDPKLQEEERLREEGRKRSNTFAAIFDEFSADHLATLRTGAATRAAVVRHVYPAWAKRPVASIRRADVLALVRDLKRETPIGVNRTLAYLKTFFSWCCDQDLIEASPAAAVRRPTKENSRDRVLTEAEIKAVWDACGSIGVFGRAFRLMLLTGQRRTEVGAMTWAEIDIERRTWTLGRERTKADRSHQIPLSDVALATIADCPRLNAFVLSTGRTAPARLGGADAPVSGWSKAKLRLDAAALIDGKPLPPWHLHDLRRTAATYLARLGVDRVVIGKVLNHSDGAVTAIYDRHAYQPQMRRALDLWAEHLMSIVTQSERSNVVPLARGVA